MVPEGGRDAANDMWKTGSPAGWRRAKRSLRAGASCILEGTTARATPGATMGEGLEPRTDCSPLAAGLPPRRDDAHQPRGHLSGAVRSRPRSSAPRTACLRSGRALRARTRGRGKTFVDPTIRISERPTEAADRAVPGHWEGDLILGLGSSAIGTLVERTTRFTMLLHLPRLERHGEAPRVKNGPALAGHGAEAVCTAITRTILSLPEQLRRSLTWDQGAEMAQHARLKIATGVQVYFCDPRSPWQRGTNENTNGLLRQYFPNGTDLSAHSPEEVAAVAATLNARPRKALAWKTPAEALDQWLADANKDPVATTAWTRPIHVRHIHHAPSRGWRQTLGWQCQ